MSSIPSYRTPVPALYQLTWISAKRNTLLGNAIVQQNRHQFHGTYEEVRAKLLKLQRDPSFVNGNIERMLNPLVLAMEIAYPGIRYHTEHINALNEEIASLDAKIEAGPGASYAKAQLPRKLKDLKYHLGKAHRSTRDVEERIKELEPDVPS